jgi:hypothetical protein
MRSVAWVIASALLLTSCFNCHVDATPIQIRDGLTSDDETFYMSSRWGGKLLHFPGGRRYVFYHGLKAAPEVIDSFLAFHANTFQDNGSASESAGNQALIECVTDKYIVLANDTCAEFWVRITAQLGPASGDVPPDWSTGADCQNRWKDLPDE